MTVEDLIKRVAAAGREAFETRDITRLDAIEGWALKEAAKLGGSAEAPAPRAPEPRPAAKPPVPPASGQKRTW